MSSRRYSSFLDLPDFERLLSQQRLLTSEDFREEWRKRSGGWLNEGQLEALHRSGILVPVLRLKKPVAASVRGAKREGVSPEQFLIYRYNDPASIEAAAQEGRLVDPRQEGFRSWRQFRRTFRQSPVRTAEHLYSWHQLTVVDQLESAVHNLKARRGTDGEVLYRVPHWYEEFGLRWDVNLDVLILLALVDHVYRPRIVGRLLIPEGGQDEWERWIEEFSAERTIRRVGIKPDRLREIAEWCFARARFRDPHPEWWPLMRLARPDKWQGFEGQALQALDSRMVGEMLLLLYEDLARSGETPSLPNLSEQWWEPRRERLTADAHELDRVLTEFGLSPHPAVVLVLEGETEEAILPKVQDKLGFHPTRSEMEVVRLPGVGGDVGLVASYAAVPAIGRGVPKGLLLDRPLTHVLVAVDAEGPYKTPEMQEARRRSILEKILDRLPPERRTEAIRRQLDGLVSIVTWGREPFEFAHFSNGEIARGVDRLYKRRYGRPPERKTWAKDVEQVRRMSPNVLKLRNAKRMSKVDLALELWPVLERKIDRALDDGNIDHVPIAGLVARAARLVDQYSRRLFMLSTEMTE